MTVTTPHRSTLTQFRFMYSPFLHYSDEVFPRRTVPQHTHYRLRQKTKAGFLFFSPGRAETDASNTWRTAIAPPDLVKTQA